MANETMSFVLITALFGMAVVALFLTLLSFVMHLIRTTDEALVRRGRVDAVGGEGPGTAGGRVRSGATGSGPSSDGAGSGAAAPPLWAIAAAAVYLDAEDEVSRRSATPWTARSGR